MQDKAVVVYVIKMKAMKRQDPIRYAATCQALVERILDRMLIVGVKKGKRIPIGG